MKKLAAVLVLSLSASPVFAAGASSAGIPNNMNTNLLAYFNNLAAIPLLILSGGRTGSALPPFSETYKFNFPGFGAGPSQPTTLSYILPALGTLDLTFKNGGAGNTFAYTETLTNP